MTKELSYVILELHNARTELSNVRKKIRELLNVTKERSHINVKTAQYDDEIIKCDVLETWYSKLLISGYRKKKGVYSRITHI